LGDIHKNLEAENVQKQHSNRRQESRESLTHEPKSMSEHS
jgi:hypothetical protein